MSIHKNSFLGLMVFLVGCATSVGQEPASSIFSATTVEMVQTTNISTKINKIGGLPKSVRIRGVSDDGTVVVGRYRKKQPPYEWQTFRYTLSRGMELLGNFGQKSIHDICCISADGMIMWGSYPTENDGLHIFRYRQSDGFQDVGNLGKKSPIAYGVSRDGAVVVGSFIYSVTDKQSPIYHAFRYSQSQGFEDLGAMGGESAFAHGISDDGSLVVGNFHVANDSDHAFLYSQANGVQDIGAIGGVAAFATGVSNDGSVIAGDFYGGLNFFKYSYDGYVFIYTKNSGVKNLKAINGKSAGSTKVSSDGTKIVGAYTDSDGESYAFIARIVR